MQHWQSCSDNRSSMAGASTDGPLISFISQTEKVSDSRNFENATNENKKDDAPAWILLPRLQKVGGEIEP